MAAPRSSDIVNDSGVGDRRYWPHIGYRGNDSAKASAWQIAPARGFVAFEWDAAAQLTSLFGRESAKTGKQPRQGALLVILVAVLFSISATLQTTTARRVGT
jgi:hypothetical protein